MVLNLCRRDGQHLLEDAADRQRDDVRAPQQRKLGADHAEGDEARGEQDGDAERRPLGGGESVEAVEDGWGAFGDEGEHEEGDEHDGREKEEGGEWVGRGGMPQEQDLGQRPAEAGEATGRDHEDEAERVKGGFSCDHHDDTGGHGRDDEDQLPAGGFKAEEEGKEQDEGEGGRFAHGVKSESNEFKGHVTEANVEGGGGAARDEASEVEERGQQRRGWR